MSQIQSGNCSESFVRSFIPSTRKSSFVIFSGVSPSRNVNSFGEDVVYFGHEMPVLPLGSRLLTKLIR